jgi:hypothetical protein
MRRARDSARPTSLRAAWRTILNESSGDPNFIFLPLPCDLPYAFQRLDTLERTAQAGADRYSFYRSGLAPPTLCRVCQPKSQDFRQIFLPL